MWALLKNCSLGGVVCAVCVASSAHAAVSSATNTARLVFNRVHFSFGSDRLSRRELWKVHHNVQAMQVYNDMVIWLEGHTDAVGSAEFNVKLGDRRVRAVAAALIAAGIDPERIAGMVSFGEERAAVPYNPRRVEMQER